MKPQLDIRAPTSLQQRYRSLLKSEYSPRLLADALQLCRDTIEAAGLRLWFRWEEEQAASRARSPRKQAYPIPDAATDYLRDFLERANQELRAPVPADPLTASGHHAVRRAQHAYQASVLLTFQSRVGLSDETGFFRDCQSLLFLACRHVLLPDLAQAREPEPHDFLLNAMEAHVRLAWTDDPAHQNYLWMVIYDYVGDTKSAATLLLASLNETPVEAHDFVTKGQALWSLLIEAGRFDDAKEIALSLYRRASGRDLGELRELIDETYRYEPERRRAS